ncbi:MAG: biotin/lipoyl-containing protein [Thermomicrobiales bacterium]
MSLEIRVPSLGESIVDATVVQWLKNPGEQVDRNEPLVELETDRVNVEVPAEQAAVLESISREAGETVEVGEAARMILESAVSEEAPEEEPNRSRNHPPAPPEEAEPARGWKPPGRPQAETGEEQSINLDDIAGTGPGGRVMPQDVCSTSRPRWQRPSLHRQRRRSTSDTNSARRRDQP